MEGIPRLPGEKIFGRRNGLLKDDGVTAGDRDPVEVLRQSDAAEGDAGAEALNHLGMARPWCFR
jgi:hypothetical protein